MNIGKYPIADIAAANPPYPSPLVVYIAAAIHVIPNNMNPESIAVAPINIYFNIHPPFIYITICIFALMKRFPFPPKKDAVSCY